MTDNNPSAFVAAFGIRELCVREGRATEEEFERSNRLGELLTAAQQRLSELVSKLHLAGVTTVEETLADMAANGKLVFGARIEARVNWPAFNDLFEPAYEALDKLAAEIERCSEIDESGAPSVVGVVIDPAEHAAHAMAEIKALAERAEARVH